MRKVLYLFLTILAIGTLFLVLTKKAELGSSVTLWQDINYQGDAKIFSSDDNDLTNNPGCEDSWNDCVSSISVSSGYEIILYADTNFEGSSQTFDSSVADLGPEGWDNIASSIKVSGPAGITFDNPLAEDDFKVIINNITDFIFQISIVVVPLVIVAAGFLFVTAGGEPQQISTAKKIIIWALVGFFIVLLAKGISTLLLNILNI
ncbi:MAG: peptidase inhibitor family I36 protein [Patescibacteria group bacterium]|nr:peptidase inhibitor family I36 protein [Patescibacteria group bacterium]